MRFLLSALLVLALSPVSHASTINHFDFSYGIGGIPFDQTFDIVNGAPVDSPDPNSIFEDPYTYTGVALNGNVAGSALVSFSSYGTNAEGDYGLFFQISSSIAPELYLFGSDGDSTIPFVLSADGAPLFQAHTYTFGNVFQGSPSATVELDYGKLTITQTTTPDPVPTTVTPEPGTLPLLGTGLLGLFAFRREWLGV